MAITNPQAIRVINEEVRPLCEEVRAVVARIESLQTKWYGGLNVIVTNTSDAIEDGRESEGVSRLTGVDINSAMTQLIDLAAGVNAEIVQKPCVRPIQVS